MEVGSIMQDLQSEKELEFIKLSVSSLKWLAYSAHYRKVVGPNLSHLLHGNAD